MISSDKLSSDSSSVFSVEDAEPISSDSSSDSSELAGEEGIEPSFSDLESAVLPLSLFSSSSSPSSEGVGVLEGIPIAEGSGDSIFSDCEFLGIFCSSESSSF